jgi:hypothetical protein
LSRWERRSRRGVRRGPAAIWQRAEERCYEAPIVVPTVREGRGHVFPPVIVPLAATFGLASLVHAEILIAALGMLVAHFGYGEARRAS